MPHKIRSRSGRKTTNVRSSRASKTVMQILGELRRLLIAETKYAFEIGDLVVMLKKEHGMRVKEIAVKLGVSAQRLGELKRTAEAYSPNERRFDVDVHYYTIAGRAARRLKVSPVTLLDEIVEKRIETTRNATRFLAQKIAAANRSDSDQLNAIIGAKGRNVIGRCHHDDYRRVVPRLPDGSVKLMIADPPYGQYGRVPDGKVFPVSSTRRDADNLASAEAREVTIDLFRLMPHKMIAGGCIALFRPGGLPDPSWLLDSAEIFGWDCQHAVTWHKKHIQLGDGRTAYSISTERILFFVRVGEVMINHDGSSRSDVIEVPPIRPNYTNGHNHHLWGKPVALAEVLIGKHTYEGELVFEPFGASGFGSVGAVHLGRRWVYSESNEENFQLGAHRIAEAIESADSKAS